jgi:hypothetical protein
MARKIYKRIGLRRDKNLSDLSNSNEALNNLLDTLVDGVDSTFISEDLNSIRNIFSSGLSDISYRNFIGSAAQKTNENGINIPFSPKITYQNRLDKFSLFSGNPRISGGNGLTASYYNKNQVFENTLSIFSGEPIKQNNFWEAGNFEFTGKIIPESSDVNGGVQWEGYFIPTETNKHIFHVSTTALMTFHFQTEGYTTGIGTYSEISRIGLSSSFSASGTKGTNQIRLNVLENTKYIGIGQSVSGDGIVPGTVISDSGYDRSTGVINLKPPSGISSAVSSTFTDNNLTFSKAIGQSTEINYSSYVLQENEKYRILFRYYIPQSINADRLQRNFNVLINLPGTSRTSLRYNYLYGLDYDFSENSKGIFNLYYDNSVRFGGGTIGGATNSNNYVKVKSSKKVDIRYQPKTNVSDIIKSSTTATITNGSSVISIPNTSGIEIGNYIFGTGIPEGTVVNKININNFILINNAATSSGSVTLDFIDHRGFVKRAVGSSVGKDFTLSRGDTSSLKSGMIMIGSGIESYTGITTGSSSTTISISPSQNIGAETTVYFYQSSGLINNGLAEFCSPDTTKCMVVTSSVPVGYTTIPVSDSSGVANGWKVQGIYFDESTTVNGAPTSTTAITLNKPTIRLIPLGANFTVTSNGDDRELCCPPTDTSPPFNATVDGLETPSTKPNLRIESGNVKFDSISAVISSANITNYKSTDTSGNRIKIGTPSGDFKILCT